MTNVEKSDELFNKDHFHCSQAVFASFAEELGLSKEMALKIGGCFGAGMNKGEVCGAVTGALMALGLKYGQANVEDLTARAKEREGCMSFYEKFEAENGSCICRKLLGYDFGKPKDLKYLQESKIYLKICPKLVESATKIAADLMKE